MSLLALHCEPDMTMNKFLYAAAIGCVTAGIVAVQGQAPLPSEYAAHLKAAKDAARFDWVGVLARNCIAPAVGPVLGNYSTDPGRDVYYAEPEQVFAPITGPGCGWCDFRRHCPEGQAASRPRASWDGLGLLDSSQP